MKKLYSVLLSLCLVCFTTQAFAFGGGHWTHWAHRPWSPQDLAPTAWFSDGDLNTGTGVWIDRSSSANTNNTIATNATLPTAGTAINGRTTAHFTTSGGVQTPSISLSSLTIIAVENTSSAGYVWVHKNDGAVDGGHQYTGTTETNYFARSSVVSHKRFVAGLNDGVARSLITTFDGTTAGNLLYSSGVLVSETTVTGNDPGAGPTSGIFCIGANQGGNTGINGDIGEIIVVPRVITAAELARISFYLLGKWGV